MCEIIHFIYKSNSFSQDVRQKLILDFIGYFKIISAHEVDQNSMRAVDEKQVISLQWPNLALHKNSCLHVPLYLLALIQIFIKEGA